MHYLNSDADRALFGPFEKAMLPLWLSTKSALDLVATLEPGDAVLPRTLAVLQHVQAQDMDNKGHAASTRVTGLSAVACPTCFVHCFWPFVF